MFISQDRASPALRKRAATIAVILSLGLLAYFKYFGFLQINLNHVLNAFGADGIKVWEIILPVGISFYIFQALSYTVDVYRGTAPPAKRFTDFACYISLFPQLVAGPIIHYKSVAEDLRQRPHTYERFSSGALLFVLGFSKKILLANPLGSIADGAFNAQDLNAPLAWFGVIAYALQIYFDFCAYSDMAVGLGRMFGFEFIKNFNDPYKADSITDFWRRWHISLSSFLRDYLYIPLGGNRRGHGRTYVNLALVMVLGGLWHGANWTFIIWGAYHGGLLIFERWASRRSFMPSPPRWLRIGITFVLVLGSWVWFRAESVDSALKYFTAMLGGRETSPTVTLLTAELMDPGNLAIMAAAVLVAMLPIQAHEWSRNVTWPKTLLIVPTFAAGLMVMFFQTSNPFLYFQF